VSKGKILTLTAILMMLVLTPAFAQDQTGYESWTLPGDGASTLVVNPADGSVWTFLHQTGNLVALDPSDGSVMVDAALAMRPSAMAFTPDGEYALLVGEPLGDQIIDQGLVHLIDPSDGAVVAELELEGSCNAVYAADDGSIYVATGMQYGYQGTVYRLAMNFDEEGAITLDVEEDAACGKIPWAIISFDGVLYVTDLELQWGEQPDGTMGPPYGAWVWEYDAQTLAFIDKSWVGINPSRMVATESGVLVACSGSKIGSEEWMEPALSLIAGTGESDPIFIGTSGASDLDVSPDGTWAVATLADWGPPAEGSAMSMYQHAVPGAFPEARRWVYTGKMALVEFPTGGMESDMEGEMESDIEGGIESDMEGGMESDMEGGMESSDDINPIVTDILPDEFLRAVAISSDGTTIYALAEQPERIIVIPVSDLMQ
jgi:hypothetical protein